MSNENPYEDYNPAVIERFAAKPEVKPAAVKASPTPRHPGLVGPEGFGPVAKVPTVSPKSGPDE